MNTPLLPHIFRFYNVQRTLVLTIYCNSEAAFPVNGIMRLLSLDRESFICIQYSILAIKHFISSFSSPTEWDVAKVGWYKHHPHLGYRFSNGLVRSAFDARTHSCAENLHDWSFKGNFFHGSADSLLSNAVSVQDLYRYYLEGRNHAAMLFCSFPFFLQNIHFF